MVIGYYCLSKTVYFGEVMTIEMYLQPIGGIWGQLMATNGNEICTKY